MTLILVETVYTFTLFLTVLSLAYIIPLLVTLGCIFINIIQSIFVSNYLFFLAKISSTGSLLQLMNVSNVYI